ncbi:MAG: hypothetical protein KGQ30_08130, partial [Burkholderiales bacterium]|nr:hypothetical protein [Burkholderiales bacterium]
MVYTGGAAPELCLGHAILWRNQFPSRPQAKGLGLSRKRKEFSVSTPATANDFELMFKLAPVSLWLEDYSALKALFDELRSQGVRELTAHLRAHPDVVAQCASSLRVLQVNQRTLDLFGAKDQAQLIA